MRRILLMFTLLLVGSIVSTGCAWTRPRSSFDRDPLVQSHLLHRKNQGLASKSSSDSVLQSAGSISNKPKSTPLNSSKSSSDLPAIKVPAAPPSTQSKPNQPNQIESIIGTVVKLPEHPGTLYVRFAPPDVGVIHNGMMPMEFNPRLGMLREGDQVRIEGKYLDNDQAFRVSNFTIL